MDLMGYRTPNIDRIATDKDDPTDDPRFGKVGKQKIEDTGPLTKERMETIDDDIAARAADFIQRQVKAGKPFFVWVNFTHMHFRTHAKPQSRGQAGRWMGEYADVMIATTTRTSARCCKRSTTPGLPRTLSSCTRPITVRT